jgi:uncharacterized protein
MKIELLNEKYSVYKLDADHKISIDLLKYSFATITKTKDEISIVCETGLVNEYRKEESGWKILKIIGPLDFGLIGILSKISTILADAKISIFAISTFDTDYIMIKEENIGKSIRVLKKNGYEMINENG